MVYKHFYCKCQQQQTDRLILYYNQVGYQFLIMNRPYSAKQGYWGIPNIDEKDENSNKIQKLRKNVKYMKPDLTTNDFGRILPRKMYKDKERLYSEGLQLKQAFNEVTQQNTRLKTQLSMLQKEQDRISRLTETSDSKTNNNKSMQNANRGGVDRSVKVVPNLKKIIREARQQNLQLRNENSKIKKAIKYIKINELEIQLNVIIQENKKLARLAEDHRSQMNFNENLQVQNEELREVLERQYDSNKQLIEENKRLIEQQQQQQSKFKSQIDKWKAKEVKWNREIAHQRKINRDNQRHIQDLRRQLKGYIDSKMNQSQKKPSKSLSKPSRHHKMLTEISLYQKDKESKSDINLLKINQKLTKEIANLKLELANYKKQIELQKQEKGSKIFKASKQINSTQNKQSLDIQTQKQQSDIEIEAIYQEQFEKPEETSKISFKEQDNDKLSKLKEQFQDHSQQEHLFKKQPEFAPKTKVKTDKNIKSKKKQSKKNTVGFKPNKQKLSQIKQLLTYRMKSQRYPYEDLKNDIESAQTQQFTYVDLINMLVNEPFYLSEQYSKIFLHYCFQKQQITPKETLSNKILVDKLRKMIDDFVLLSEQEEKEMIIRIAQMTTTYPQELHIAFENIKNGEQTVAKKDLIDMFKKLQLQDQYIDLIIAELSLCSDDLEHINFHGFFQRFYIGEAEMEADAIEELKEQSDESKLNSSRAQKNAKKSKDGNISN